MLEERMKTAQQIISIMDKLLKESNMSLVVKNGKAAIMDHDLNKLYTINNNVNDVVEKHLGY